MDKELLVIFNAFTDIMRSAEGILGAWNFGSAMHGLTDEYSDADIVLLVEEAAFTSTERSLNTLLSEICDEVILCWEEDFNNEAIVNNGYLIKKNGRVFQFDVFLLNRAHIDDFMCRIHYADLSERDIIFDRDGSVRELAENCPHGSLWSGDTDRLIRTYLYHFSMTAKYLLRRDYFKLNHVMRVLYDAHASLLLTKYDSIKWGGAENKLRFIPEDKKSHLMKYYCTEDYPSDRERLLQCFEWFERDINDGPVTKKGGHADINMSAIKEYWIKCTHDISL